MQPIRNLSFGYKTPLKHLIGICAYTGASLSQSNRSFEHILPHSKGGTNAAANCLITGIAINNERGNMPFFKWLTSHPWVAKNVQNYLDKYRNLSVGGINYVEQVKRTLNREAKGVVTFTARA